MAVSEYNQLLVEDSTTNRVVEAATLFDSVVNSRWFQEAGVLLFFNKTDLLEAKLQTHPFRDSFPDFTGENKPVPVQTWYKNKFASLYRHQWRELFPHFTCATGESGLVFASGACAVRTLIVFCLSMQIPNRWKSCLRLSNSISCSTTCPRP